MAISDDRITNTYIKTVSDINFNDQIDLAKTNIGTNSTNIDGIKNLESTLNTDSVFAVKAPPSAVAALNNNNNADCERSKLPNKYKRNKDKTNNDRSLNNNIRNIDCSSNLSPVDQLLAYLNPVKEEFNVLTTSSEAKVDSMMNDITKSQLGLSAKKFMDNSPLNSNVKTSLIKSVGVNGASIKSKLNLDKAINKCDLGVKGMFDFDIDGSLFKNLLADLINGLSCAGPYSMLGYVDEILNVSGNNKPAVLKAMSETLTKSNDVLAGDKLTMMRAIKSRSEDPTDVIHTKGVTKRTLDNIAAAPYNTNSSVSEYQNTTAGLDSLDANWDKDDQGNVNYSATVGNSKMYNMSNDYLLNKYNEDVSYDGTATTNIDRATNISIVNKMSTVNNNSILV